MLAAFRRIHLEQEATVEVLDELASGDLTRVIEPTSLLPEALEVIEELLRHHEASTPGPIK